ncbi:transposase [Chryseobacterium potabilaquae]|uniref:Uncharacterized protein n=1 Tax=Chryseobacterium potabilaquae TaxID=2675057 RepID=A0A6N4XD36_9FLAO|nr:transposase [Chryseobacterium potabilaquae]CAA7196522.1 hypothetical protein CHRY9293_02605 [Chryseobacterium potabilaquae]
MGKNKFNFKTFHLGNLVQQGVLEKGLEMSHVCSFFSSTQDEIISMYEAETLDSEVLLKWSLLLQYDFFRIYSEHLILYAPKASADKNKGGNLKSVQASQFRKNIYTKGIIDFVLEIMETGEKEAVEIIKEYGIPKSTLNKWKDKYKVST